MLKNHKSRRLIAAAIILILLPTIAHGRRNRHLRSQEEREQARAESPEALKPALPAAATPAQPMQPVVPPPATSPQQAGGEQGNSPPSQIFTWKEGNVVHATNDQRNIPPRFNKRLDPPDPKQLVIRMGSDTPEKTATKKPGQKKSKKSRR